MPMADFKTFINIMVKEKENKAMVDTPMNWVINKSAPSPKNNPRSMAKSPTARVPNSPLTS